MKYLTGVPAFVLVAGNAFAGGLDRTGQPIQALFEPGGVDGGYAELSYARTFVNLDGVGAGIAAVGLPPGTRYNNVGNDFNSVGAALKYDFTERLSGAVIFEQPFGADVSYPGDSGMTELGGTSALANTSSTTFYLRYKFTERWSAYGGLRIQKAQGDISLAGLAYGLPEETAQASAGQAAGAARQAAVEAARQAAMGNFAAAAQYKALAEGYADTARTVAGTANGYSVELKENYAPGYVIGAAYVVPEIAARISLTYNSAITHDMDTKETGPTIFGVGPVYDGTSTTDVTTPQSVNLEFRTGVAADTLLFGSVRWVDWSQFQIDPENFTAVTGTGLVDLEDTTTYAVGLARRFSNAWAGSFTLTYEAAGDDLVSPLAPSTGLFGVTLGGAYTIGDYTITGGLRQTWLGDAWAETGTPDQKRAQFAGNTGTSVGLRVGYNF